MNSGTHWGRNPSVDDIRWHALSGPVNRTPSETAGQARKRPAHDKRPQQDSNLRSRLRRPLLSPLSYGGCATPKGTSPKPARTRRAVVSQRASLIKGHTVARSAHPLRTS